MSNHYSAANLRFPGDDARLDLTDLFAFGGDQPGRTVVIIDVNPFATGMSAMPPFLMRSDFHPGGVYRINVDQDGDALAEAAFTFTFTERTTDGEQAGTVHFATGDEARQPEPAGEVLIGGTPVAFDAASAEVVTAGPIRLFIGVRSEPFFADADGSFHGFQWTGKDAFADKNILSIALEAPDDMLGPDPLIGLWATVSERRRDGSLVQVDRGGHPTINPFISPNNVKNVYNGHRPADDLANHLAAWTAFLQEHGYPTSEEAEAAARVVLPDILRYDRSQPAAYPNGRAVTDDVFSMRFAWMSNGAIPPDGLKPHDDMLSEFPYLGPPNVYPV